jgi:PAS domain S-box-containing protein
MENNKSMFFSKNETSGMSQLSTLSELLHAIPMACCITNKKGSILEYNQACKQLFPKHIKGKKEYLVSDWLNISPSELNSYLQSLIQDKKSTVELSLSSRNTADYFQVKIGLHSSDHFAKPQFIYLIEPTDSPNQLTSHQSFSTAENIHQISYFEHLLQTVPFGIVIADDKDVLLDCNHQFEAMFGFAKSDMLGRKINDIIVPISKKSEGKKITSLISKGIDQYVETIRQKADGQLIHVAISGRPITLSDGVRHVFGVYQDITERTHYQKAIQDKQLYFQTLFESAPLAIVITDDQGIIIDCNHQFTTLFGYSKQELTNTQSIDIIIPDKLQAESLMHRTSILNNSMITKETVRQKKDGELIDIILSGALIKLSEKRKLILAIYRDITKEKAMQHALYQEKYLLQALMDNIPDTIYYKDTQTRFVRINKAQARVLGVNHPEEAIMKTDFDFFDSAHSKNAFADEMHLMKTGQPVISKEEHIHTNQGWKWFTATKVPMRDEQNQIQGLVGISRDITQYKQLEEKLKLNEEDLKKTNQEKDKILSVIAHDLRSPFNSFLLLTEILADDMVSLEQDELRQLVDSMYRTAINLSELLDNLLEWSRIQRQMISNNPEIIIFKELIEKNIEFFRIHFKTKEIELLVMADERLKVYADAYLLSSVIRNLISNALKFTPTGGKVTILASRLHEDTVLLRIEDTGIGMTDIQQKKLFRNDTRGTKGTNNEPSAGIGLILVKEFVDEMNGRIYLTSMEGAGTTFFVELPAHQDALQQMNGQSADIVD